MAAATRYVGPRQPVTCVLLLQPRRILRRCIFRVARRRGRDGVCARAQRADQAAPQASSIKSHSLCTCSTHAAVVPCHKDPVAFARQHAAVATRSRHACVMGCAARRASGLEDIRPVCEATFRMAAHARCISASRGDVASGANARLAPASAACAYYYLWRYMNMFMYMCVSNRAHSCL